jgi:hypothetical protein
MVVPVERLVSAISFFVIRGRVDEAGSRPPEVLPGPGVLEVEAARFGASGRTVMRSFFCGSLDISAAMLPRRTEARPRELP